MVEADNTKISKWLDVTPQQFDILETILRLQREGVKATPKNIIEEDVKIHEGPKIQKSNLFTQLKTLRGRGFVKREEKASYVVDFNGIKKSLTKTNKKLEEEMQEFQSVFTQTEEYFKGILADKNRIMVDFYEYDEMYEKTADMVKNCEEFLITSAFPRILYPTSPCLMPTPGAKRYSEILWDLCIKKKQLKVSYLTRMDVGYLFTRLYRTYNNAELAYDEANIILNNFEALMNSSKELIVFFVDSPYGVDMVIPQHANSDEFFILVREKSSKGIGAVFIKSSELTYRFRNIFTSECKKAVLMKGSKGEKVLKILRKRLDDVYQNCLKHNECGRPIKMPLR